MSLYVYGRKITLEFISWADRGFAKYKHKRGSHMMDLRDAEVIRKLSYEELLAYMETDEYKRQTAELRDSQYKHLEGHRATYDSTHS